MAADASALQELADEPAAEIQGLEVGGDTATMAGGIPCIRRSTGRMSWELYTGVPKSA